MPRGSKSSFSLFGRKSSVAPDTAHSDYGPTQWTPSTPSENLNMSKAERLLGTSGLPVRSSPSYHSPDQASQNTRPSYTTTTLPEASAEHSDYGRSASTATADHYSSQRPPHRQSVRYRPSSNMLDIPAEQDAETASVHTRDIRPERSSMTLRSYYDPSKYPLTVSQQTSESAVRDRALRKGLEPVVPWHSATAAMEELSDGTKRLSKASHYTASSIASTARQRKSSRLDLVRLFPRLKASTGAWNGSHEMENQVSHLSMSSGSSRHHQPPVAAKAPFKVPARGSSRASSFLQKPTPETYQPKGLVKSNSDSSSLHRMYDNPKINIRRPKRGMQNWFDGLLEEEDESTEDEEIARLPVQPTQRAKVEQCTSGNSLLSTDEKPSSFARPNDSELLGTAQSSHPTDLPPAQKPSYAAPVDQIQPHASHTKRSLSDSHYFAPWERPISPSSHRSSALSTGTPGNESPIQRSPPYATSAMPPLSSGGSSNRLKRQSLRSHMTVASFTSGASRSSKLADVDLRNSSALSLTSSSCSEDEDAIRPSFPEVRDSITTSGYCSADDNFYIGKAQAFEVRSMPGRDRKPSSNLHQPSARSMLLEPGTDEEADEVPLEPCVADARSESFNKERLVQFAPPASPLEGAPARPHTSASKLALPKSVPSSQSHSRPTSSHGRNRKRLSLLNNQRVETTSVSNGQKFIAVTAEEEALLEMMRSRRAAMANQDSTEDFRTSAEEEEKMTLAVKPESRFTDAMARCSFDTFLASDDLEEAEPENPEDQSRAQSLGVPDTANSSLSKIMDAFPSPSPSNRSSTIFISRNASRERGERDLSPGMSTTSSSMGRGRGSNNRHSALSNITGSSYLRSTSGTSATSASPRPTERNHFSEENEMDVSTIESQSSEHVSNASTIKKQHFDGVFHRLSRAPVDVNLDSFSRPSSTASARRSSLSPSGSLPNGAVAPGLAPLLRQRQWSEELLIQSNQEPLVGAGSSDSAERESTFTATSGDYIVRGPTDGERPRGKNRHSMRIDVSSTPPSAAPCDQAPSAPSLPPHSALSPGASSTTSEQRSAEYRLLPKVAYSPNPAASAASSSAHTSPPFQLANSSRSISVPSKLQSTLAGSSPSSSAAPAPILGRNGSSTSAPGASHGAPARSPKSKPIRASMNMANVKKAFSVHRDPSPAYAPQPRWPTGILEKRSSLLNAGTVTGTGLPVQHPDTRPGDDSERCSISEDVLAAWGNAGGWRGYDGLGAN